MKQRGANVLRAEQMHLARLQYGSASSPSRKRVGSQRLPALLIGCSGWYYWHWKGKFYPSALPSNQWFSHYASQFDTVELNAPFYSWPTLATVQTWKRQAGRRRLVYTIKVCELITHVKRFRGTKQLVADFSHIAGLLGARMGCFLFQLPPSFRYTPARLRSIVNQLDPQCRNVVEFRHRSWWNEKVYAAFREMGIIFCSCSGPRLPDELVKTADEVYVRFHGVKQWYRHDYTTDELAVWAKRIAESRPTRVWAYFNNDRDGHAIRNAKELLRLLHISK